MGIQVFHGDCRDVLRTLEENSIEAVVTDPPYGLSKEPDAAEVLRHWLAGDDYTHRASGGFMGRSWDTFVPGPATWKEIIRVMKPGAYLLCFAGTRTQDLMGVSLRLAGFEIRDCIRYEQGREWWPGWVTGVGFPKGLNVVNELIRLALWQSSARVPVAAQNSVSSRVTYEEGKGHIVVALAQILPEGDLALITETGGEVALHVPTDTWPSELIERIGLSTMWSWNGSLEDALSSTSKCITATASEMTIDQRTWNSLIGLHTFANITPCSVTMKNGLQWPARTVELISRDARRSKKDILLVSALGSVTENPLRRFRGFNVCLKPAWEPIICARKPLSESTVAANVLKHGVGGLNIDKCRVSARERPLRVGRGAEDEGTDGYGSISGGSRAVGVTSVGRWPANVIHDGSESVEAAFAAFGERKAGGRVYAGTGSCTFRRSGKAANFVSHNDTGIASRFFQKCEPDPETIRFHYSAKAGKQDRQGTTHPTTKPLSLCKYLARLICPPGGTVLDPFAGSGSTGVAALREGFSAILIEREAEYVEMIHHRLAQEGKKAPEKPCDDAQTEMGL